MRKQEAGTNNVAGLIDKVDASRQERAGPTSPFLVKIRCFEDGRDGRKAVRLLLGNANSGSEKIRQAYTLLALGFSCIPRFDSQLAYAGLTWLSSFKCFRNPRLRGLEAQFSGGVPCSFRSNREMVHGHGFAHDCRTTRLSW